MRYTCYKGKTFLLKELGSQHDRYQDLGDGAHQVQRWFGLKMCRANGPAPETNHQDLGSREGLRGMFKGGKSFATGEVRREHFQEMRQREQGQGGLCLVGPGPPVEMAGHTCSCRKIRHIAQECPRSEPGVHSEQSF